VIIFSIGQKKSIEAKRTTTLDQSEILKTLSKSLSEKKIRDIEDFYFLKDAINNNIFAFIPNLIYERIIRDYKQIDKIFGESLLRKITGYNSGYIKRNIMIPEFRKELHKRIEENIEKLKELGIIDKNYELTQKSYEVHTLILLKEEIDSISIKLAGRSKGKEIFVYGEIADNEPFKKGKKLRDINLKKSVKRAIKRGHSKLEVEDIMLNIRERRTRSELTCLLDISGSMKGIKLEVAKKSSFALAYKAIEDRNLIGFIAFSSKPELVIEPTHDFFYIVRSLSPLRAHGSTNIALALRKASKILIRRKHKDKAKGHIILISDTMPTTGSKPIEDLFNAVDECHDSGISISVIGIELDKQAEEIAKKIVSITKGRLYKPRILEELDILLLEDYFSI